MTRRGVVLGAPNRLILERRPTAFRRWYARGAIYARLSYGANFPLFGQISTGSTNATRRTKAQGNETTAYAARPTPYQHRARAIIKDIRNRRKRGTAKTIGDKKDEIKNAGGVRRAGAWAKPPPTSPLSPLVALNTVTQENGNSATKYSSFRTLVVVFTC